MASKLYDQPIHAAAEHGEVVLNGPDGIATSLTPGAARSSAIGLVAAADLAERDPDAEGA